MVFCIAESLIINDKRRIDAMETALTKEIKEALIEYKVPRLRSIRWATEVWTATGIVDFIRFEDAFDYSCGLIDRGKTCKKEGGFFVANLCAGCVHKYRKNGSIKILATCYEIKISLSDFRSANGHNFQGHENYYVAPKEIARKIARLSPSDIGVIQYIEYGGGSGLLKQIKPCIRKEIESEELSYLLHNALKKHCDKHKRDRREEWRNQR
jgi:hypothetical protein